MEQPLRKCVRYLGQQGYRTDDLIILTPYLGQLSILRDRLSKTNDPVLNDLDAWELHRAGLIAPEDSNGRKNPIRISTIGTHKELCHVEWDHSLPQRLLHNLTMYANK